MSKQLKAQKYIFKISTSRLKKAKWDLTLPLSEARSNDEVISLNDSQMLRWIDELNGVTDTEERVREIRRNIRSLKRRENTLQNRKQIRMLYQKLDELQFKPDYMHLIIDKDKDLYRACKGFKINGIQYARLLGTNGGVKTSTIVFVSERLVHALRERIDNGRNNTKPQIPAKLEAYRALTCSGSIPVSLPRGILVVPDCFTKFNEDIIMLNDENSDEPEMKYIENAEVELDESDGYGIMLPSLAARWSKEIGLDYVSSGMNTRFSWEKGMVFCFDFVDFADRVAHKYIVQDAWGNEVDVRDVELILTTSMVKLWNCYDSLDDYMNCCRKNHYTFGIAKTCPRELDHMRSLNYQFIQSFNLTPEQTQELIQPTIDMIHDIMTEDPRKALLFLRGTHLSAENVLAVKDAPSIALMIDPGMINDPFIRHRIYHMIERRIRDAKIGVVDVHGNYSILCGDPYALCQSVFGLPVTGLLQAGQVYSKYWSDCGTEQVVCFRAPMSAHANIKKMNVASTEDMRYWYRYMTACTMINAWDTTAQALNGADKDGDLIFLTDNKVLLDNVRPTNTVFCVQRKAERVDVLEDDLVRANIASFGDDIGRTTNWITSMFDVKAMYEPGDKEYETLEYRIKCGQLFQQNAIDKAKGVICKPMPRTWYDRHAVNQIEDPEEREFYRSIMADKKPYFMRYIYPALMSDYNTYIKNTNIKCMREFREDIDDILGKPEDELTERQQEFLKYYKSRMPVGTNDCVMNVICRQFEHEFDGCIKLHAPKEDFDFSVMKSGVNYVGSQFQSILRLYEQYKKKLREFKLIENLTRGSDDDAFSRDNLTKEFTRACYKVCGNSEELCDIIIDICYRRIGTMQFAWDMCGEQIIKNLLKKNNYTISFPVETKDGDISFNGRKFSMIQRRVTSDGNSLE